MTSGARNGKKERSMKKMFVPHGQFYPLPSDATILSVVRKECEGSWLAGFCYIVCGTCSYVIVQHDESLKADFSKCRFVSHWRIWKHSSISSKLAVCMKIGTVMEKWLVSAIRQSERLYLQYFSSYIFQSLSATFVKNSSAWSMCYCSTEVLQQAYHALIALSSCWLKT